MTPAPAMTMIMTMLVLVLALFHRLANHQRPCPRTAPPKPPPPPIAGAQPDDAVFRFLFPAKANRPFLSGWRYPLGLPAGYDQLGGVQRG
jgi:hypothetical protein